MAKRVSREEVRRRVPDFIEIDWETYTYVKKKARFIDKEYGEFWAVPGDVFNGSGHRLRGNAKISKARTGNLEELKEKLPEFITIKEETYVNMASPATFIDSRYGEFQSTPKNVLRLKNTTKNGFYDKFPNKRKGHKYTPEEIEFLLPEYIKLDKSTYVNTATKCRFIDDKYGEFFCTPNGVLHSGYGHLKRGRERARATCLKKYGVEHVSQDREIMSKMKRNARKTTMKYHWKDSREILCCGSYECSVVDYLNDNNIDYDWQIKFKLTNNFYYCDLYLIDEDKYIEIKGWWRQQISKDKWLEFHEKYPNSELWSYNELKSKGILKYKSNNDTQNAINDSSKPHNTIQEPLNAN